MKQIFFSVFLLSCLFSSCTSKRELHEIEKHKGNSSSLIMKINANVEPMKEYKPGKKMTKAAIESNVVTKVPNETTNICILRKDTRDLVTPTWYDADIISGTIEGASSKKPGEIVLNPVQYFSNEPEMRTHIIGYYPPTSPQTQVLSWNIDGKKDILISNIATSSKKEAKSKPLHLVFKHQLSWLRFQLKAEDSNALKIWGDVTKIDIVNIPNIAVYTLGDDASFSVSGSTTIPTYDLDDNSTQSSSLSATDYKFYSQAIVPPAPFKVDKVYTLRVYTQNKPMGTDVKVTFGASEKEDTEAGKKYIVSLTFKSKTIEPMAVVEDWIEGAEGHADVH